MRSSRRTDAPLRGMDMVEVFKRFHFEAAHKLPQYPQIHGHSYTVEVWVQGEARDGYVIDELELDAHCRRIHDVLDHTLLNDIVEPPTSENIARWIWQQLKPALDLSAVWVYRGTVGFGAVYRGR